MIMSKKKKSRMESVNFLTTVITFILLAVSYNGIEVSPEKVGNLAEALVYGRMVAISIALISITPIIFKICKKVRAKEWTWQWLKSKNFITQAITFILMVLVYTGAITEAQQAELIAGVIHMINMLFHFYQDGFEEPKLAVE